MGGMRNTSLALLGALCVAAANASFACAQEAFQPTLPPRPHTGETICRKFEDLEWKKDRPAAGDRSSETVLLREDAKTGASELIVRLPAGFRLPMHWHSANQTHTVISGTWVIREEGGEAIELPAGSFNYTPARVLHEGWVKGDEPAVLFVTFDAKRDTLTPDEHGQPKAGPRDGEFLCITPDQFQWQKFDPGLPPEFAILNEHPVTKATQLLIRCPADVYVPMHWHSSNETHTVLEGDFIVNCGDGMKTTLSKGSYNYFPGRFVHNARIGPKGATLFITVDGPWDIHWVESPFSTGPADPNDLFAKP